MAKDKGQVSSKQVSSSGGKAKKKKWSKGKVKEKANNAVTWDKATYDKLFKEVPTYKLITPAMLVDRIKVSASLARVAIRELESKGLIKRICTHSSLPIYTRAIASAAEEQQVATKA